MSKLKLLYSLKPGCLACAMSMVVFLLALGGNAHASNSNVIIVNGTTNHCLPYLSCYAPYEMDVKPGDTVTWVNNDNRTHTATAGTPNHGPVGLFDSGPILPGHSYSQFFGTMGKYPYYDQMDMWPSGVVVVSNQNPSNAEIGWVNGSLSLSSVGSNTSQKLVMTKQIKNSGGTDATSVIFRLRILNDTGFLFYDNILNGNVPAKQNSSVSFTWSNPLPGKYRLNFDAENLARQSNENIDVSSDLISISKSNLNQLRPIITNNFAINNGSVAVPEFGQMSFVIFLISAVSVMAMSTRSRLNSKV